MLKKLKTNQRGFTIIEVMIVLAVAALIILIVLLAVPALQRNSRNTAIKNDASAVAAGITEYESNNNGSLPNTIDSANTSSLILCRTGGGGNGACPSNPTDAPANVKVQGSDVVKVGTGTLATTSGNIGHIQVDFGYECNGNGASPTVSARSTAILYLTETSGTPVHSCVDA